MNTTAASDSSTPAQSHWQQRRERERDMRLVTAAMAILFVPGAALLAFYGYCRTGHWLFGSLFWGLALFTGGAGVGFLFGIPRVKQNSAEAQQDTEQSNAGSGTDKSYRSRAADYELRVNTNLEEISDWLTKIIVGLGLVELKGLDTLIRRVATQIALSFGEKSEEFISAGIAVLLFFGFLGALYGYLMTRLYLQGALRRAEGDSTRVEIDKTKQLAKATAYSLAKGIGRDNVEDPDWKKDPYVGFAQGQSQANGRKLAATIRPVPGMDDVCLVHLEITSTDPARPLTGHVLFHLHPTFQPPDADVAVGQNGKAELDLLSLGAFTVGAEVDNTRLELALSSVPGGTQEFYAR